MKTIVRIFYIIGIILGTIGFTSNLLKLIAINGLGDFFEIKEAQNAITNIVCDSTNVEISYTYQIEGKEYNDSYKMFIAYYEQCNVDTIVVKYNRTFPIMSYIEGVPLKERQFKIGLVLSSFFLLFLILIWRFSNKEKWVKTYKEVGNRPWLYPEDKSIKNPWIRFTGRLFRK